MKLNNTALIAAAALSTALIANAIPAKRDKRLVTQPDGTTLTVHMVGDEHNHFLLTDDDKLIVEDENGQYSYATVNTEGIIKSTNIRALDSAVRPAAHKSLTQSLSEIDVNAIVEKKAARRAQRKAQSIAQSGMGTFASFPKKGDVKGLIILVEYPDSKFKTSYSTSPLQYFTDMASKYGFDEYGGTGCAQEYFEEQSFNQFRPKFDVVGPYTMSHNVSYYGSNDSYGNDSNPEAMIVEACQLADDEINFADYDNDGDGYCDNVFVIYAGKGEASGGASTTIWPHSYNLSYTNKAIKLDDVTIDRYACSNEWVDNRPDGVGTFIHEFSHVMGLPDLYNTTSTAYYTPCSYDALDYGPYNNNGCTPPAYSVFERNAMEWIDLKLIDDAETITLGNIADTNEGCIVQTSKEKEFYLFENRQQTGWDAYIPGHGMLIWHIDYDATVWSNNRVNNTASHQRVDIVEANNKTNGSSQNKSIMAGWTWPGTYNKTEFTGTTNPAFVEWSGAVIDLPITNIQEENGIITFDVAGGSPSGVPVPDEESAIEKGEDYFVASWSPVEDATDYKLWVYAEIDKRKAPAIMRADEQTTEVANMGSGTTISLPEGWESSTLGAYTGSSNCGEAAPSAKMTADGNFISTRKYDGYDVVGVQFWMKGVGTSTSSNLLVEGLVDEKWVELGKFVPTNGTAETFSVSMVPDGVSQVKFTYNRDKGNIGLDDIVITLENGISTKVLPDYDGILTNGATSVRIDKLMDGCTTYKFKVASTPDGERFSKASELAYVNLGQSGVNDLFGGANASNVVVNDRTITVNTDAERVEVYNTMGSHILTSHVSDGSAVVTLPTSGLFIVRTGNTSTKVVVR